MATKYYLLIEGVHGNSLSDSHQGWFDVSGADIGVTLDALAAGGPLAFGDLSIQLQGISPALLHALAGGSFGAVQIQGVDVLSNQVVYDLRLDHAGASSFAVGGAEFDKPVTSVSFNYGQIGLITPDGSAGFDVLNGVVIDPLSITPPPLTFTGGATTDTVSHYFLAIEGVDGNSAAVGHENWFELNSLSFSAAFPPHGGGGGGGAGKPLFGELSVNFQGISPQLDALLASGAPIGSVKVEGVSSTTGAVVYELRLGDAHLSADAFGGSGGGGAPDTQLVINYGLLGLITPKENVGFDLVHNVFIDPTSIANPTVTSVGGLEHEGVTHYFLQVSGIDGGSVSVGHVGWFDVLAVTGGMSNPGTSSGGGGGSGKTNFQDLSLTLNGLSPALIEKLTEGLAVGSVKLEGITASGQVGYQVLLGGAHVSSQSTGGSGGGGPIADVSFNYEQIGVITPDESFGFDVAHNTVLDPSTIAAPTAPTAGGAETETISHYYLTIDGVNGGSTAVGHAGAFEILSSEWGMSHTLSGLGVGKANFQDLSVSLAGMSPHLLDLLSAGATIKSIDLEAVSNSGAVVYDLRLGKVMVTSDHVSGAGGDQPATNLSFSFTQFGLTTTQESFGFDITSNASIDPASIEAPTFAPTGGVEGERAHYYLVIDGLDGGTTSAAFAGAFDVAAFSFGAAHAGDPGGLGSGKANFDDLNVILPGVSSVLFADAIAGGVIGSVRLEGVSTTTGAVTYDLRLGAVTVSSISESGTDGGDQMISNATFHFGSVGLITPQESFGFNIADNHSIDPASMPVATHGAQDGADPAAARHYFVKIDGIKGDSVDAHHKDWFDLTSISLGVSGPLTAGGAGGGGSGKPNFSDIAVSLIGASPALLHALESKDVITSMKIEGIDVASGAVAIELRLGHVNISADSASLSPGQDPNTQISLAYQQIGMITPHSAYGYDLHGADVIDPTSIPEPTFTTPAMTVTGTGSAPGGTAENGEVISYAISVQNTGTAALTGIAVTDPFADAGSLTRIADAVGNNDATLDVGETWSFTASHTVTPAEFDSAVTGGTFNLRNTVNATATGGVTASANIDVPTDHYPTNGGPLTATISEDGPVSINLLQGASDPDPGQTLNADTPTGHATSSGGRSFSNLSHDFIITNGVFSFSSAALARFNDLAAGQTDTLVLPYLVSDGVGLSSQTSTLTLTIVGADEPNTRPVANADVNQVTEDTLPNPVTGNVLTNDTDADGNTLTVTNAGTFSLAHGTVVLHADGTYAYTLDNGNAAVQALNAGQKLIDTFTYQISDGHGGTDSAVLSVTINGTNDGVTINGSSGSDTISPTKTVKGQPLPTIYGDTIFGNAGDDKIDGGQGGDHMSGGKGSDTYYVDNAGDVVTENVNEGSDSVIASVAFVSSGNIEYINLTGMGNIDATGDSIANVITGNAGNNVLSGLGGNDTINAGAGNDTLNGGEGNDNLDGGVGDDTLNGDNGNDQLYGGGGNDHLFGSVGNDKLDGGAGNDDLSGGDGVDTLDGGTGMDLVNGGLGNDTLTGGGDADTFLFNSALTPTNIDKITDFKPGLDKIKLDHDIFGAIGPTLDATEFYVGKAAHDLDDRIIYNPTTGKLYYDADGSGAGVAIEFADLAKNLSLHATDFLIG